MSDFEFDVVMPPKSTGVTGEDKYGFSNFPIGASKFIPNVKSNVITSCAIPKNKGAKFATRQVTENGVRGVRIWRLL